MSEQQTTINRIIFYDFNYDSEPKPELAVIENGDIDPTIEEYTVTPVLSSDPYNRYLYIGARALLSNGLMSDISAKAWIHVNSRADVTHVAKDESAVTYTNDYICTDEDTVTFDCSIELIKNPSCLDTFSVAKSWIHPYYKVVREGTTVTNWEEVPQEDITKGTGNVYTFTKIVDVSTGGRYEIFFKWKDALGNERVVSARVVGQGMRLKVNSTDYLLINATDKLKI